MAGDAVGGGQPRTGTGPDGSAASPCADRAAATFRYGRETAEFARVSNLSDAVFAIAMTLLVLTLDVPRGSVVQPAATLVDQLPQIAVFALAFGLVANLWWQHHKLSALFEAVEPGMVGLTLVLLGAVAIVPFPTALIGGAPTDRVAVLAFIATFTALSVLFLLLVVRANVAGAFRGTVTDRHIYVMLGQWASGIVVLLIAALMTVWIPVGGLAILALTIVLGPVAARGGVGSRHRLIDRYLGEE